MRFLENRLFLILCAVIITALILAGCGKYTEQTEVAPSEISTHKVEEATSAETTTEVEAEHSVPTQVSTVGTVYNTDTDETKPTAGSTNNGTTSTTMPSIGATTPTVNPPAAITPTTTEPIATTPTLSPPPASSSCSHSVQIGPNSYLGKLETVYTGNEPTCTKSGYFTQRCTLCGEEFVTNFDALGHFIDSTCVKTPYCTQCGKQFEGDVNPNDHRHIEYDTYVGHIVATCITEGYAGHKKVCMQCGYVFERGNSIPIDPSFHSGPKGLEVRGQIPSTCQDGYSGDYYCLDCGKLASKGQVVPAMGCVENDAVPATCCTYSYCTRCGVVWDWMGYDKSNHKGGTEVRDAFPSSYPCCNGYSGDTYCLGCNAIISKGQSTPATQDHSYQEVSRVESATEISITSQCTVCGTTSKVSISIG